MRSRVLVTGASGLIGRQCLAMLAKAGFDVIVLNRHGEAPAGMAGVSADLLDSDAVASAVREAEATRLLHLAWHADPRDRWTSAMNLEWIAATLHLVKTFRAAGGQRAVCAGSCAEYDWSDELLREDTPLRPATLYGAAKAATGMSLIKAAPTLNVSFAWARIFFCYGPGEPPGRLFGDLLRGLVAKKPVDCTDGLQERDFLHTADVAAALTALLGSDAEGPINIASGETIPVRELIMTASSQMQRPDLIRLGALPRPPTDPPRLAADVSRLRNEVGFRPRYDLASGIAQVLAAEGVK